MGKALEILREVRKTPNLWVHLIEKTNYKEAKDVKVSWGDDKSSGFIELPISRGHRWINAQIIEKICVDANIIMDYIEYCRENKQTPKKQLEVILASYIVFLSDPYVVKDEDGRYKPGPSSYHYLHKKIPRERKDRTVKTG